MYPNSLTKYAFELVVSFSMLFSILFIFLQIDYQE